MPKIWITLALMVRALLLQGQSPSANGTYEVYLFLLEDCKITQAYTDELRSLHQKFSCDSIRFTGFFPNPVSEEASMRAFVDRHELPFACTRQAAYPTAVRFGVSVTPEVVVYHPARDSVYYQGRIDNLFPRVGQRRQVVTTHELRAALDSIRAHRAIAVARTEAVGCFLQ
ncbi:MAG: hypothetical protein AAFW73_18915 [Bacteroidota bacterium]